MPPVTTRIDRAGVEDAARLSTLAAATFVDTFGADNDPADMAAYVAGAFGTARQRDELRDPANTVFVARRGDELLGYAMLRAGPVPPCVGDPDAVEIARLYAATAAIGSGVGAALMERCLAECASRGRRTVWLGVWERNARAIAFYRRWQFVDVGTQRFQLGSDRQTDHVMARTVAVGR
jgi:ribosomal protein S18 acetylase RimI-like enzyme